jgi:hypothetical protein
MVKAEDQQEERDLLIQQERHAREQAQLAAQKAVEAARGFRAQLGKVQAQVEMKVRAANARIEELKRELISKEQQLQRERAARQEAELAAASKSNEVEESPMLRSGVDHNAMEEEAPPYPVPRNCGNAAGAFILSIPLTRRC